MRSFFLVAVALSLGSPSRASAQPTTLRELARDTAVLRADVGESYRRLMALQSRLLGTGDGARIRITQESAVDPFYRLVSATYSVDGQALLTRAGDGIVEPLAVFDGVLGPGDHTLSVVLRYEGHGHGVIGYLPGYRFLLRSSHPFTAPTEGRLEIRVRPFTRDPTVPFTERLGIVYEDRALGHSLE